MAALCTCSKSVRLGETLAECEDDMQIEDSDVVFWVMHFVVMKATSKHTKISVL